MIWGEHDDFSPDPVHDEITGTGRWHIHKFQVFKRISDGTFWGIRWSDAATEMQEPEIWDPPFEVEAHETMVTVIKWEKKQ
jgi:hypothetical protein